MTNHWQRRAEIAAAETSGVIVECATYLGWKFHVLRRCQWNHAYHSAVARISVRSEVAALLERQRANPDAPLSAADRATDAAMMREAFAEGCLAGWTGVTDENDKPLDFSLANVARVLEVFPDIFAELTAASADASRFAPPAAAAKAAVVRGN